MPLSPAFEIPGQKRPADAPASQEEVLVQTNEALRRRILELEDYQQRVEADAAKTVAMAEELAITRDRAEAALRQAREYQETIQQLALHDPLTGIANRNEFNRRFVDAVQISKREGSLVALLLLDLDHFKGINDSFGHPIGDELLKFVATHLAEATRETDTVARLGGDEFAIVLTALDDKARASQVAERIIGMLSKPVTLGGSLLHTGTSIGISLYPRDGLEPDGLLRTADKALYVAKSRRRGTYQFFDEAMDKQARAARIIENELRLAFVRDEFVLHYQPQLAAGRDEIVGVEALVRWRHPRRGLLYPGDFIVAAETSGLIGEIGQSILVSACRQGKAWETQGLGKFPIAVNVSSIQFRNDNFVGLVEGALEKSGLDPCQLELEVTESLMMEKVEAAAEKLQQLHALGINMAIDDFGTGYSSLAYLKWLPIHKLKIDRTFVDNLADDPGDMAIARAIVNMGHSLGHVVIAEGVESERQAAALLDMGCDEFQGYLFSKPLPADDFARWLAARNGPPLAR